MWGLRHQRPRDWPPGSHRLIYPDCARAAEASPVSAARARHLGVLASKAAQATGQFAHQVLRVEAVLLE